MHRVTFSLRLVFLHVFNICLTTEQASIIGEKTPGVRTPGDPHYFSEKCLKPVKVQVVRPLLSEAPLLRRKLLARKKRPPAWNSPHLNEQDYKEVDDAIRFFASNDNYCPFYTKNCIKPGVNYILPPKLKETVGEKLRNHKQHVRTSEWENLPIIEKGAWGSCALVGLADTLLRKKRGEEIDTHDTVIRLGELQLWDYREFVGSKTDVTWFVEGEKWHLKAKYRKREEMLGSTLVTTTEM